MGYILNQFNQSNVPLSSLGSTSEYMSIITSGKAMRRERGGDNGVTGGSLTPFFDECIKFGAALRPDNTYYFHAKIKRLATAQKFYLYLVDYDNVDTRTQYLKTIEVEGGDVTDWVDLEFLFTPVLGFNCLLFQLQRTIDDYRLETRYPRIVYEELSIINNALQVKIVGAATGKDIKLTKMGVQSHPGLIMCINGEEIRIGRSGAYEVRNGIIKVDFFSVITAAEEDFGQGSADPLLVNGRRAASFEEFLAAIAAEQTTTANDSTNSKCIYGNSKLRGMDAFTLDYMYEEVR